MASSVDSAAPSAHAASKSASLMAFRSAATSSLNPAWNIGKRHSPLRRTVTLEEIGGAAVYLLSPLAGGVTGEIHYVDSGYNIISAPRPDDLKKGVEEGD